MDLVKRDWGASGLNSIDVSIRAIGVLCHTPSLSLASLSEDVLLSSYLPLSDYSICSSQAERRKDPTGHAHLIRWKELSVVYLSVLCLHCPAQQGGNTGAGKVST